ELGIPLSTEPGAALLGTRGDRVLAAQVLGDGDAAGEALGHLLVDPAHQAPAVLERIALVRLVALHRANVERHVETQPVDAVLVEPVERVVADELAHLRPAVIRPRVAPGRVRAPVVVEIDAALLLLAPAVEAP